jgi:hypothetical protein
MEYSVNKTPFIRETGGFKPEESVRSMWIYYCIQLDFTKKEMKFELYF